MQHAARFWHARRQDPVLYPVLWYCREHKSVDMVGYSTSTLVGGSL